MSNPVRNFAKNGGNSLSEYHNESENTYWSETRNQAVQAQLRQHAELHNEGYSNSNFSQANKAAYKDGVIGESKYEFNNNINKIANQAKHEFRK